MKRSRLPKNIYGPVRNKFRLSDVNTRLMKKMLGAVRVVQSYHNKHVDGSGNFGLVIAMPNGRWYRIDADYSSEKDIKGFRESAYGSWMPEDESNLMKIRNVIKDMSGGRFYGI